MGSPIFEYENDQEDPAEQCHILVWLDCHRETSKLEAAGDYYEQLFSLLRCRSKILYAYHQSRLCNEEARKLSIALEKDVKSLSHLPPDINKRLPELKKLLPKNPLTAFEYARYLRDLEDQQTTISTNARNYRYRLKKINQLKLEDDSLEFLQNFLDYTCKRFQTHIQVDLSYLAPGKVLFQQMIDTIRGIVEIDQTECDRNLQNTIQAVGAGIGAGLGAGGIFAASFALITPENPIQFQWPFISRPPHPFTVSLVFSLLFGLVLGWGTWWVTRKIQSRTDNASNNKA